MNEQASAAKNALKWLRRGQAHQAAARWRQAAQCYQQALALDQRNDEALCLLGMCAYQTGQFAQAAECFRRALTLAPDHAPTLHGLGLSLWRGGQVPEAEASLRQALQLAPSSSETATALVLVLRGAKRFAEAAGILRSAITLAPADLNLRCELGNALQEMGQHQEALAEYAAAARIDPGFARAHYEMGCAHFALDEYAAAARCQREATRLAPGWHAARHNLGTALFKLGQVDEALDAIAEGLPGPHPEIALATIAVIIPGSPRAGNQEILAARQAWGGQASLRGAPGRGSSPPRPRRTEQRLRVGYVSSFFQRDNWMKPVWSLINRHDRAALEIHLFSDAHATAIKHGYEAHADDQFHDLSGLSNEAAAAQMARADLDLLVDLNGFSALARLPVYTLRPAPRIVSWFNMYATSGLPCFDYVIGDAVVAPPGDEKFYTEKILRVAGSYLTFDVNYPVPDISPAPAQGLKPVTFGCLAPLYKITPPTVAAWCEILRQVPGATLLLRNTALGVAGNRVFLTELFAAHGVAGDRLQLEGPADHFDFLETYSRIDLALDTFPYNGGTTTTEAIWQGVPVVAFLGDRWVARISASLLRAAGLGEFVAGDVPEYIQLAVAWATNADKRAALAAMRPALRAKLRQSPVCDTANFAREMEQLYRQICQPAPG